MLDYILLGTCLVINLVCLGYNIYRLCLREKEKKNDGNNND